MARIVQLAFIALLLMSPPPTLASPAEDANTMIDRWSAA
jgi:hypothetical protein